MALINGISAEHMSGILVNRRITLKEEKAWLGDHLKEIKKRRTVLLVAEAEGALVGICTVQRQAFKMSHRAIFGIALAKKWRGKGIGEELSRKALELSGERMKGLEMIELNHFDYNKRASRLYRKLGFIVIGRTSKAIKEGPRYFDEHYMRLEL